MRSAGAAARQCAALARPGVEASGRAGPKAIATAGSARSAAFFSIFLEYGEQCVISATGLADIFPISLHFVPLTGIMAGRRFLSEFVTAPMCHSDVRQKWSEFHSPGGHELVAGRNFTGN